MKGFGPHLLVDAYGCPPDLLWSTERIDEFLKKAIEVAEMTLIMGPFSKEYYGTNPDDVGSTGVAVLAESHITIHTFPLRDGFITIDLYSCKEFPTEALKDLILETFKPKMYDMQVIIRGKDFTRI